MVTAPVFAQGNSSGNNTRDNMGNFIKGNTSSTTNNGHSLMKFIQPIHLFDGFV